MTVYVETETLGSLGARKGYKKMLPFIYGAAAVLTVQKLISPSVKNMLEAYTAKRKAARTAAKIKEANLFRSQLMSAAPELFTQQPGMPSPAEIRASIQAAAPGQPIPITVVEERMPERVVTVGPPVPEAPPPVPVKPAIPKGVLYAGAAGVALVAAKIFKLI